MFATTSEPPTIVECEISAIPAPTTTVSVQTSHLIAPSLHFATKSTQTKLPTQPHSKKMTPSSYKNVTNDDAEPDMAISAQTSPHVTCSPPSAATSTQTESLALTFNATSQTELPFEVHKLTATYDDADTQTEPPAFSDTSPSLALTGYGISARFGAISDFQPTVAVLEPIMRAAIVLNPENSTTNGFIQNHPKTAKSPVLTHFSWADDTESLPIAPPSATTSLKHPRNLSGLCSSSTNPFSSLQRRYSVSISFPSLRFSFFIFHTFIIGSDTHFTLVSLVAIFG